MYFAGKTYFQGQNLQVVEKPKPKPRSKGDVEKKKSKDGKIDIAKLKKQFGNDIILMLLLKILGGDKKEPKEKKEKKPRGMRRSGRGGGGGGGFQTAKSLSSQRAAETKAARLSLLGKQKEEESNEDYLKRILKEVLVVDNPALGAFVDNIVPKGQGDSMPQTAPAFKDTIGQLVQYQDVLATGAFEGKKLSKKKQQAVERSVLRALSQVAGEVRGKFLVTSKDRFIGKGKEKAIEVLRTIYGPDYKPPDGKDFDVKVDDDGSVYSEDRATKKRGRGRPRKDGSSSSEASSGSDGKPLSADSIEKAKRAAAVINEANRRDADLDSSVRSDEERSVTFEDSGFRELDRKKYLRLSEKDRSKYIGRYVANLPKGLRDTDPRLQKYQKKYEFKYTDDTGEEVEDNIVDVDIDVLTAYKESGKQSRRGLKKDSKFRIPSFEELKEATEAVDEDLGVNKGVTTRQDIEDRIREEIISRTGGKLSFTPEEGEGTVSSDSLRSVGGTRYTFANQGDAEVARGKFYAEPLTPSQSEERRRLLEESSRRAVEEAAGPILSAVTGKYEEAYDTSVSDGPDTTSSEGDLSVVSSKPASIPVSESEGELSIVSSKPASIPVTASSQLVRAPRQATKYPPRYNAKQAAKLDEIEAIILSMKDGASDAELRVLEGLFNKLISQVRAPSEIARQIGRRIDRINTGKTLTELQEKSAPTFKTRVGEGEIVKKFIDPETGEVDITKFRTVDADTGVEEVIDMKADLPIVADLLAQRSTATKAEQKKIDKEIKRITQDYTYQIRQDVIGEEAEERDGYADESIGSDDADFLKTPATGKKFVDEGLDVSDDYKSGGLFGLRESEEVVGRGKKGIKVQDTTNNFYRYIDTAPLKGADKVAFEAAEQAKLLEDSSSTSSSSSSGSGKRILGGRELLPTNSILDLLERFPAYDLDDVDRLQARHEKGEDIGVVDMGTLKRFGFKQRYADDGKRVPDTTVKSTLRSPSPKPVGRTPSSEGGEGRIERLPTVTEEDVDERLEEEFGVATSIDSSNPASEVAASLDESENLTELRKSLKDIDAKRKKDITDVLAIERLRKYIFEREQGRSVDIPDLDESITLEERRIPAIADKIREEQQELIDADIDEPVPETGEPIPPVSSSSSDSGAAKELERVDSSEGTFPDLDDPVGLSEFFGSQTSDIDIGDFGIPADRLRRGGGRGRYQYSSESTPSSDFSQSGKTGSKSVTGSSGGGGGSEPASELSAEEKDDRDDKLIELNDDLQDILDEGDKANVNSVAEGLLDLEDEGSLNKTQRKKRLAELKKEYRTDITERATEKRNEINALSAPPAGVLDNPVLERERAAKLLEEEGERGTVARARVQTDFPEEEDVEEDESIVSEDVSTRRLTKEQKKEKASGSIRAKLEKVQEDIERVVSEGNVMSSDAAATELKQLANRKELLADQAAAAEAEIAEDIQKDPETGIVVRRAVSEGGGERRRRRPTTGGGGRKLTRSQRQNELVKEFQLNPQLLTPEDKEKALEILAERELTARVRSEEKRELTDEAKQELDEAKRREEKGLTLKQKADKKVGDYLERTFGGGAETSIDDVFGALDVLQGTVPVPETDFEERERETRERLRGISDADARRFQRQRKQLRKSGQYTEEQIEQMIAEGFAGEQPEFVAGVNQVPQGDKQTLQGVIPRGSQEGTESFEERERSVFRAQAIQESLAAGKTGVRTDTSELTAPRKIKATIKQYDDKIRNLERSVPPYNPNAPNPEADKERYDRDFAAARKAIDNLGRLRQSAIEAQQKAQVDVLDDLEANSSGYDSLFPDETSDERRQRKRPARISTIGIPQEAERIRLESIAKYEKKVSEGKKKGTDDERELATIKASKKAEAYIKSQEQFFGFRQPLNPFPQTAIPIPANTRPLRDLGTFGTGEEPEWVKRNRELELTEEGRSQLATEKALRKVGLQPTKQGEGSKTLQEISEAIDAAPAGPQPKGPKKPKQFSLTVGGKTYRSTKPITTGSIIEDPVRNITIKVGEELVDDRSSDEKIQSQLDSPEGSVEEVVSESDVSEADVSDTSLPASEEVEDESVVAGGDVETVEELELDFDDA